MMSAAEMNFKQAVKAQALTSREIAKLRRSNSFDLTVLQLLKTLDGHGQR